MSANRSRALDNNQVSIFYLKFSFYLDRRQGIIERSLWVLVLTVASKESGLSLL